MPVIDCDPDHARDRVTEAGVEVVDGNTDHERWRAERDGAVAVAYDEKVVVQGSDPERLAALVRDGGGRGHVYFDGASRGNPGPAAIGWAIVTGDGIVSEGSERIPDTTNNKAEYAALIRALEAARDYGLDEVDVRGDSQLVVKQVRGEWNVNEPTLREKRVRARELLERFDRWDIEHVPREINERADELANEAFEG
ncbi:ribonuclease HI [Halobaculum limi]|uniref:ribonuclease HI n=1 Tax=Halobaculum limi TaxID=3031916 RepID=UPI002404C8CF|nr:ribonuclease HI [Halobaculum sp. YSMS11]